MHLDMVLFQPSQAHSEGSAGEGTDIASEDIITALSHFNISLFWWINSHNAPALDRFFLIVTYLGNAWVVVPILGLAVALKVPRERLLRVILVSAVAMTAAGLGNSLVKVAVKRPRPSRYFAAEQKLLQSFENGKPSGQKDNRSVHLVGHWYKNRRSFPSGHSNTAFVGALVLGIALGGWWWLALIPAGLVAYSRVYLGAHFPLDCAGGALIALAVGGSILWLGLRAGGKSRAQHPKHWHKGDES
jgi:undecaprenyl-diphosphatase